MPPLPVIRADYLTFHRHDRRYCIFMAEGREEEFLYCSYHSLPLRSLVFGRDLTGAVSGLLEDEALCIECGLGGSVGGGVSNDGGNCIAWHFSIGEANRLLTALRERIGEDGQWIELF
jgi:hypothetical protein